MTVPPASEQQYDAVERELGGPVAIDLVQRDLVPRRPGRPRTPAAGAIDRARCAVLGAAIGNALARPTRGRSPAQVQRRLGNVDDYRPWKGWADGPTGTWLAEIQLLAAWGEALAHHRRHAAPALSRRLPGLLRDLRSPGSATVDTVARLGHGVPWFAAAPDSYGCAALTRAVADGIAFVDDAEWRPLSAATGALVTHAHPRSTGASALVAEIVAAVVADPDALDDVADLSRRLARTTDDRRLASALSSMPDAATARPVVHEVLPVTLSVVARYDDPVEAVLAAVNGGGASDTTAALVGALVAARHGTAAFPIRWLDELEERNRLEGLAQRLTSSWSARVGEREDEGADQADGLDPAHIWFLLDRSGSMQSMADVVPRMFDAFVDEQRHGGAPTRFTLAQFDSEDPFELVYDAEPLDHVQPFDPERFRPRAMTPLYDAIGRLIDRADRRIARNRRDGRTIEDPLVVILSDGMENHSRHLTRQDVFDRITDRRAQGWEFVFLGANQDSYATGAGLGIDAGSVSNFDATPDGMVAAMSSVSRSASEWRARPAAVRREMSGDFFGGVKEAEAPEHPRRRRSSRRS